MEMRDIILTGMPRSGTALACYLLNQLPDTVALVEPMDVGSLCQVHDDGNRIAMITEFFSDQRKSARTTGKVLSKATEDGFIDNTFGRDMDENGLRKSLARLRNVKMDKRLPDNFQLIIKHPNAFTALLGSLITRFPCFAIIRNPLAVLASWSSVNIPVHNGRTPIGESLDPMLSTILSKQQDRYMRQISLLSWYYEKYSRNLPETHIIRYEDIVSSSGRCLEVISPSAAELSQTLESRNKNALYDANLIHKIGTMLLNTEGSFWHFYRQEDIEQLMQNN
jgi:hypothetical protein